MGTCFRREVRGGLRSGELGDGKGFLVIRRDGCHSFEKGAAEQSKPAPYQKVRAVDGNIRYSGCLVTVFKSLFTSAAGMNRKNQYIIILYYQLLTPLAIVYFCPGRAIAYEKISGSERNFPMFWRRFTG